MIQFKFNTFSHRDPVLTRICIHNYPRDSKKDENKFEYPDKSGNGIAIATSLFIRCINHRIIEYFLTIKLRSGIGGGSDIYSQRKINDNPAGDIRGWNGTVKLD